MTIRMMILMLMLLKMNQMMVMIWRACCRWPEDDDLDDDKNDDLEDNDDQNDGDDEDDIESRLQVDQVEKSELVTCRRGRRGLGRRGRRTQIEISGKGTVMLLMMMMVIVVMLMMMKRTRGDSSGRNTN